MKTIGRHLIAEFYGCSATVLDDLEGVRAHMRQAATTIGATIVGDTFHRFSPQGISGTVVIAESHLSVHTWPESGYGAVDIYTCGGLDPYVGFRHLAEKFHAQDFRVQEIIRGLPQELAKEKTWVPSDVQVITRMVSAKQVASAA